jgi:hypothetical protein
LGRGVANIRFGPVFAFGVDRCADGMAKLKKEKNRKTATP